MKKPQMSGNVSERRSSKLSSRPRQYVDVTDVRQMLKLGLGLHAAGDPLRRLNKALNGLGRMTDAEAWFAAVLTSKGGRPLTLRWKLSGGTDALTAWMQIEADLHRPETAIGKLFATPRQTPGRVLALIEHSGANGKISAIHSLLRPETPSGGNASLTWISIHRKDGAGPFVERERRMVELFHSQSAWLMLRMAE